MWGQDRDARLDDRAKAEPLIEPARAVIALGADPDLRRRIGTDANGVRGECTAESRAPALRAHEHLGDLAAAVVRLHLGKPGRATAVGAAITRTSASSATSRACAQKASVSV